MGVDAHFSEEETEVQSGDRWDLNPESPSLERCLFL